MLDRILIGSSAEPSDPNFKNVTLLLHGDGSNGAQNNTFLDSSTNNFTITRNGNTTQGSFSPYGSNWSNYFDGTGDWISVPDSASLKMGSSDFTYECWLYPTAIPNAYQSFIEKRDAGGSGYAGVLLAIKSNGKYSILVASNSSTWGIVNETSIDATLNTWQHIAVVRSGSTFSVYKDGVRLINTTISFSVHDDTSVQGIGAGNSSGDQPFYGYISNVRIVKGTAVYSGSSFTPPTAPLTAITNTSLLTCQSNRFRDASTNNFTITRNGDVKVTNFAPFAPTAAYSTSTNGGSGYFDGSGDYLTLGSNAAYAPGSGDFTWECWVYPTATPGVFWITDTSGGLQIGFQDASTWGVARAVIQWYMTSTTLPTNFMWNHIAVTRSGSNMALFLNGTRIATKTSATADFSTGSTAIMANLSGVSPTAGYTTDIRLVKGTAIYDPTVSTYTVPTAPLTAVTNTGFLAKCQNAAIFDNSMKNDLETVGNAQISTSVKKFGTGSMYFPTSAYAVNKDANIMLGSSDFTIEFWVNSPSNEGGSPGLVNVDAQIGSDFGGIAIVKDTYFATNTGSSWTIAAASLGTFSDGTWRHIAVVRSGNTIYGFNNGVIQSTTSFTGSIFPKGPALIVGKKSDGLTTGQSYIDDLRITKGLARYTANFTPPTAAFPNK